MRVREPFKLDALAPAGRLHMSQAACAIIKPCAHHWHPSTPRQQPQRTLPTHSLSPGSRWAPYQAPLPCAPPCAALHAALCPERQAAFWQAGEQ